MGAKMTMPADKEAEFLHKREAMVREQIAAKGVSDRQVLDAMRMVSREKFVLPRELSEAYDDTPLPIDCGQTISQPYMVALMTECLELKGSEKVLEIGTGSGYQTAILCLLCEMVYSVEKHPELCTRASSILKELGLENFRLIVGDGTKGWPEHAPYDGIIVTAGAPDVPAPLIEQLAVGGRLVIPVGDTFSQILRKLVKTQTAYETRDVCGCRFVPLVGEYGWAE
jgi:protein-L-isoaspartate(D-aspartate) O-methyltransferase